MVEQAAGARSDPRGFDRRRPGPTPEAVAVDRGAGFVTVAVLVVFMACMLIPGSFFVGSSRVTPYRMFLLLTFVPLMLRFLRGGAGRATVTDLIAVLYVGWIGVALFKHEGAERYDFIIMQLVEVFGGYLVGRALVRGAVDYRALFLCFFWGLLLLVPFAAIEMLTKQNLLGEIAATVLEPFSQDEHPPRLGFFRAQVSFEHPILFGLFCSLGFANAYYIFRQERLAQAFWTMVVFFTTFASLSSAPLLATLIQMLMMFWDRLVQAVRSKWLLLAGFGVTIFILLDLITPDGAVSFLVNNLTLVPATADYRIMTLQYSMETLRENLLFGVGHSGDVDLPWWHTGSIDNYWLSTAVNHGLPATLLLIALIVVHLWRVMMATGLDATAGAYRSGHLIAVTGLIFTLTTVHIWGAASVMVMAYLGAGVWIYAPRPDEAARRLRRRAPVPAPLARAKEPGAPGTPSPAPLPTRVPHAPAAGGAPRPRGSTGRYGGRR